MIFIFKILRQIFLISLLSCISVVTLFAKSHLDESYQLAYILPADKELTLEQLIGSDQWQLSNDGWIKEQLFEPHFWVGDTPKIAWLKLDFNHESSEQNMAWIELASSGVTRAILFQNIEGDWQEQNSDVIQKSISTNENNTWHDDSPIRSRFISFLVSPKDINGSIYLRVEATDKLHLQVNIKSNQDFIIDSSISNFIYAMGYGILLVMVLYNLFIGFSLKDPLYYIYSSAIFSTLLYQFFAHGHARLFAHFNWDHVNYSLNFLVILITTLSMYFMYYVCNIKIYTPKIAKPLKVFLRLMILLTFLALFIPTNWSLNIILIVVGSIPMIAVIVSLYAWYKGSPTAGIFLFSWMAYIIGGFLWQGYWLGLVTLNDWVEIPLIAGASLESILLSLALAYRIRVLSEQTSELKVSNAHYKKISQIDPLTKLANRRAFDAKLKTVKASKRDYGLIIFDIDHFKQYNDQYGHPAGDKVITEMAKVLKRNMRDGDLAARIGGEEFAVVISTADSKVLLRVADRIRLQFNEIPFNVNDEDIYCSVSAGYASSDSSNSIRTIIDLADKALYRAKESGRNKVVS